MPEKNGMYYYILFIKVPLFIKQPSIVVSVASYLFGNLVQKNTSVFYSHTQNAMGNKVVKGKGA